jgi:T-complex protein 1 subunit gamma
MKDYNVWETYAVKVQTLKTAIESACMLLRVDDIVSGISKKRQQQSAGAAAAEAEEPQAQDADDLGER